MLPAIHVEKLSKCYQIGRAPAGFFNMTEVARRAVRQTWQKLRRLADPSKIANENVHWALRDVEFDIQPGETVGIVGRNGAGKSTLLKLLSRITAPTTGRIEIRGRMGSLLEVGTGFHPELSGRENVHLNGSILGMKSSEIRAKFDRIVAFAEIGEYLDSPVKHYSSGMYVRLAFSIAAHMEPEILIVDEVLAVGDAVFQRRCIDRMAELASEGRTILFVSHNMQLVPRLCQRAIYLEKGTILKSGPAEEITRLYLDKLDDEMRKGDLSTKHRLGDGRAKFVQASLIDATGKPTSTFVSGDDLRLRVRIESREALEGVTLAATVQNTFGTRLVTAWTRESGFPVKLSAGTQDYECKISRAAPRPGQSLLVDLALATDAGVPIDVVDGALHADVIGDERHAQLSTAGDLGVWLVPHEWSRLG